MDYNAPTDAGTPPDASATSVWTDLLAKWNSTVSDFQTKLVALQGDQATAQQDPALAAEYQTVLDHAAGVQDGINAIGPALTDVVNWLNGAENYVVGVWNSVSSSVSSWFGLSGYAPMTLTFGRLGVVWLIPAAVVAGAIAAIAVVANEAYSLHTRLGNFQQLVASGTPPAQAAATVGTAAGDSTGGGIFGGVTSALRWAVVLVGVGGIAYVAYQNRARFRRAA